MNPRGRFIRNLSGTALCVLILMAACFSLFGATAVGQDPPVRTEPFGMTGDDTGGGGAGSDPGGEPGAIGEPGVAAGSSQGSSGMPDTGAEYLKLVKQAEHKGKTSREYIGSLIGLGMHYNRQEQFPQAIKALRQALSIIDAGAIKPAPTNERVPEKIIEHHQGETVSAEVVRTPYPYEETMQELLPQLITAEMGANDLAAAERHIKRLIGIKGPNDVADKMSLINAYTQYAELMRKLKRPGEAEAYQKKADEINASFIPL